MLLVAKASVVLLSALFAAALLGRSAASTRHRLWSVAFALVLAVPALALTLPALNVPIPAIQPQPVAMKGHEGQSGFSSSKPMVFSESPVVTAQTTSSSQKADSLQAPSWPFMVEMIWALGCVAALGSLALSLFRVGRLSKASEELSDDAWQSAALEISARLGLGNAPRLVVSERVLSPMAGGVARPTVFLPLNARGWDAERRDVVLTHEIAHLASRDPLRHLVARLAVACYWFHPLAWLAAHRATVSREQACDEAVLAAGTRPSAYARVLLELAESTGAGAAPLTALPMAQRSNLEKRLMTILKNDPRRSPSSTRVSLLSAAALALVTLSVAAARPAAAVIDIPVTVIESRASALPPGTPAPAATTIIKTADAGMPVPEQPRDRSLTDYCRRNNDSSNFGWNDNTMVVETTVEGTRVCLVAVETKDRNDRSDRDRPSQLVARTPHFVMSTERTGQTLQLEETRTGGSARTVWQVNGRERSFDSAATRWRDSLLAVLDASWEAAEIRGEESSLRGQISSVYGHESSLRGQISSLRGQVSSMMGEISSVQGQESSLRGKISSIEGQLSSLRGAVSSEQGAISSLNARRYDLSSDDRRRVDAQIDDHRRRIKDLEQEIASFDVDAKVREVEKQIDSFNSAARVREIQKKIDEFDVERKVDAVRRDIERLNVAGQVRDIEKQIESLNADDRVRAIESRKGDLVNRLRDAMAAIR
jgi:beta-lactamase regulating signal transducer with metallopeptidase domain/predicted  nucleic acid-binding Zn-ribbon protein